MKSVVCFVAREPGWRCLQALFNDPTYKIGMIFSHRRKPTSEDPNRSERPGYQRFKEFAEAHSYPLFIKDTFREAADLSELDQLADIDFIVSCNWKFKIPKADLNRARLGTLNLHRGKLPEYRGLEPVRRTLEDGRDEVHLSAHVMEEEYDTGDLIEELTIPAGIRTGETIEQAVERLKIELYPLYPIAMLDGLNKLSQKQ